MPGFSRTTAMGCDLPPETGSFQPELHRVKYQLHGQFWCNLLDIDDQVMHM
jgi:hypothetical protein